MKDSIQLLRKLNEHSARALNEAASLCLSRGHQEILPEHLLIKLLENDNNDLNLLLRQNNININRLWDDLLTGLDGLNWQHGNQKPELSRALVKWLQQAWLIASVDNGQQEIRSLNLLQAIQKIPSIFTLTDLWQLLMFRQGLLTQASQWLNQYSVESPEALTPKIAENTAKADEVNTISSITPTASQTPAQQEALARFTLNLTERAREGHIDAIFGRDDEIAQIEDILSRRRKNNPILVGEPGVGKTALVEGLALKIAHNQAGSHLQGVQILALDMGLLQAGAGMKGEFEQRLKNVIEAIQHHPQPTILFIDEAHTLIGAGNEAGGSDAANLLKPALARGQLRTIAATTWREYKQYFETDAALTRRFQPVKVDEPDNQHAIQMLRGLADLYAAHHQVHILDEAIEAAVILSRRYLPERQLPDKAIDLIDTACAKVRLGRQTQPLTLIKQQALQQAYQQEITRLENDEALGHTIDQARLNHCRQQWQQLTEQSEQTLTEFQAEQLAAQNVLTAREQTTTDNLPHYNQIFQQQQQHIYLDVDAKVIASIISEWTGIATGQLLEDELQRLLNLTDELNQQIIGQEDSIEIIVNHIRIQKMGLGNSQQPLGVFLLTGPSGIGKTKTAQALSKALFNSDQAIITINMSEYQEPHSVAQLKGAPPGYVGYGQGGILTEAVRKQPYAVILLDEIEKAHPDVLNLFYQVFDQGIMRDGEGRLIDFKNTIILMTANIGSEELQAAPEADLTTRLQLVDEPLRQALPAALLGRMQILAYHPLGSTDMAHIIRQQLAGLFEKIHRQLGASGYCSDELINALAHSVAGHDLGVRHFEHTLQQQIIPELARQILLYQQQHQRIAHIQLDMGENGLLITLSDAPADNNALAADPTFTSESIANPSEVSP
ncbi:type VI secretion system ATPase TssH [Neisseriaceae bacterium ESL0693]|nr:type VI secretion system ATPase TssH [Neisseriaceae bacterium ESL0693]